jgi:hypothetical protein
MPPCPFLAVTGLPCPLCGATRAFEHAAAGDLGFLQFNGFWVLLALALGLYAVTRFALRRPWPPLTRLLATPATAGVTIALVAAGGWAWAFAQRATIT